MKSIPTPDLTIDHLPPANAEISEIDRFALTFNAYEVFDFDTAADIANARRQNSIDEMRTCLFFEQRRWRHFGMPYDSDTECYLRKTLERLRDALSRNSNASGSMHYPQ